MKYNLTLQPETTLERSVATWLRAEARGSYEGDVRAVMKDLAYGGCASGMVGHLVYMRDAAAFYMRHRREIGAIVAQLRSDMDWNPSSINGWDDSDPFALEPNNRNYLAWLGFEETARVLCERAGWQG
jgi:hypothetical protein